MIFHQFRHDGCLSYLVGDGEGGGGHRPQGRRTVLEAVAERGLKLVYVIDTIPADHHRRVS